MRPSTLQLLACLAMAAAGLVPVFHKNKPFWGVYGVSVNDGSPRLHQIDFRSPAEAAGLRTDDVVLSVDGVPVSLSSLNEALDRLSPGQSARLRVQRGTTQLDLEARAVDPPIAMIYFPTIAHPIIGGVALLLALLLLATQPLQPSPGWRTALVALVGIAGMAVFFVALLNETPFATWQIREFHTLNWGDKLHFGQSWVGLAAASVLAVLATWEIRSRLIRRLEKHPTPPPL